jgi:hypothetical protein
MTTRKTTNRAAALVVDEPQDTKKPVRSDETADAAVSEAKFDLDVFLAEEGTESELGDFAAECLEVGLHDIERDVAQLQKTYTRKLRGGHPAKSVLSRIACAVAEAQEWFKRYRDEE